MNIATQGFKSHLEKCLPDISTIESTQKLSIGQA